MNVPPLRPAPLAPAVAGGVPQAVAASPESDRFETMLNALRSPPEGFLAGAPERLGPAQLPVGARMFNEAGLFGRAAPEASVPTVTPAVAASAPVLTTADLAGAPPLADPVAPDTPEAAAELQPKEPEQARAAPPRLSSGDPGRRSGRMAEARGPVLPQAPARAKAFERAVAERQRSRRREPVPREKSNAAVQLALQTGGEGVAVVARAQRLSREEQLRLRVAIDALLARHGLAVRRVTINGETEPPGGLGGER